MASRHRGFDPNRLNAIGRQQPGIVSGILVNETPEAKGFTEIKVVGVGGGGNNTVNRMIEADVRGIDFIAVNSDAQALEHSLSSHRLQIGRRLTRGLGAGGQPSIGERSALENANEIEAELRGAHMVFVTAGMGGGTGTGAAPIIADIAHRLGALTVGIVTRPFPFEGAKRRDAAEEGVRRMKDCVDALIVIPNERLLALAGRHTSMLEAFRLADDILHQGISGIADLVLIPGLINLDFADVQAVMRNAGTALMAMGEASGPSRARIAAQAAVESPLLESSIAGAKGIVLNVSGGNDLALSEIEEAAQVVADVVDPEANIILGAVINHKLEGQFKITLIATGFGRSYSPGARQSHTVPIGTTSHSERPAGEPFRVVSPAVRRPEPPRHTATEAPRPVADLDVPAFIRRRRGS